MVETGGPESADVLTVWRVEKSRFLDTLSPRKRGFERLGMTKRAEDCGNKSDVAYREVNKCPILSFFVFR